MSPSFLATFVCVRSFGRAGRLAPANPTVSDAIFLLPARDQPFGGLIQISNQPMLNALHHLAN